MRAREFLIEYNRIKVANSIGDRLISAVSKDRGMLPPDLKKNIEDYRINPDQRLKDSIVDTLLASMESIDPTQNKEYVPWIAKQYSTGEVQFEDITSKGADWLLIYHKAKIKKLLKPEQRDIGIMSFSQLGDLATDEQMQLKLQPSEKLNRGTYDVILNNSLVRIIQPKDEAAAKFWGQNTKWCTAAEKNNMFNSYADQGEIYIFIPKNPTYPGEKYQIGFEAEHFMDKQDKPIHNLKQFFTEKYGDLVPLFDQLKPNVFDKFVFMMDDAVINKIITDTIGIYYDELEPYIKQKYFSKYPMSSEFNKFDRFMDKFTDSVTVESVKNGPTTFMEKIPNEIFTNMLPDYFQNSGIVDKTIKIMVAEIESLIPFQFSMEAFINRKGIPQVDIEAALELHSEDDY